MPIDYQRNQVLCIRWCSYCLANLLPSGAHSRFDSKNEVYLDLDRDALKTASHPIIRMHSQHSFIRNLKQPYPSLLSLGRKNVCRLRNGQFDTFRHLTLLQSIEYGSPLQYRLLLLSSITYENNSLTVCLLHGQLLNPRDFCPG